MALRIGELLIQQGVLTHEDLHRALEEQRRTGEKLGVTLIRLGLVDETTLIKSLAKQLGILRIALDLMPAVKPEILAHIPEEVARRLVVMPLHVKGARALGVVMMDPSNQAQIDELAKLTGMKIEAMIATPSQISLMIERSYHPVKKD